MYFIYTIALFLTLALSSLGVSTQVTGDAQLFFQVVSAILGSITIITTCIMLFYNLNQKTMLREHINEIRCNERKIIKFKESIEKYKTEFKVMVTEFYPSYEKEIFKGMASTDIEALSVIMVKYPELKFDGILTNYMKGVKELLQNISKYQNYIEDTREKIFNVKDDAWLVGKDSLPTYI